MNRPTACVCSLRSALWTAPGCSGGRCVTSVASFSTAPCTSPLSPSPPSRWTADRFVWDRALPLFPLHGLTPLDCVMCLTKRCEVVTWMNECLNEYALSLMESFRHINKENIRGAPAAQLVEIAPLCTNLTQISIIPFPVAHHQLFYSVYQWKDSLECTTT